MMASDSQSPPGLGMWLGVGSRDWLKEAAGQGAILLVGLDQANGPILTGPPEGEDSRFKPLT